MTENDEVRMLRDTMGRFVADHMPRTLAAIWDKENHFPREVFARLAELGLMGLTVPEQFGGAGYDIVATMVVIEELSRRSLAVSVPYIMAACYAGMNIVQCASDLQKQTLLPRVLNGSLLFAYGWSEPNVGADLASVGTTAIVDGDEIIINGAKRFCSGAAICDYIYTLVRTGPPAERHRNLSFVLIPPDAGGVIIEPIDSLGMKGAATTDVIFNNVRVPIGNLMGGPEGLNRGWQMLTGAGLDIEKLEVAAIALGIGTAATEDARAYAQDRKQFGNAISSFQSIRHKLADMMTQLHAARLMLYNTAREAAAGGNVGVETAMTKLFVTEAVKSIVLEAQSIAGAYGYVKGLDFERYVRDALLMPIIGGSSHIQRNNIANWSGLPR